MCLGEKMPKHLKKASNQPDKDPVSTGDFFYDTHISRFQCGGSSRIFRWVLIQT